MSAAVSLKLKEDAEVCCTDDQSVVLHMLIVASPSARLDSTRLDSATLL